MGWRCWAGADDLLNCGAGEGTEGVYEGGECDRAGEVRDQPDVVRLAEGGDLFELGQAADVRQRDASVVDDVPLHQFVEVPAVAELFAGGERRLYLRSQGGERTGVLTAQRILDE